MRPQTRHCLFCNDRFANPGDSENLRFMDHLAARQDCSRDFEAWTQNMAMDFQGD